MFHYTTLIPKTYLTNVYESNPNLTTTKNIVRKIVATPAAVVGTVLVTGQAVTLDIQNRKHKK